MGTSGRHDTAVISLMSDRLHLLYSQVPAPFTPAPVSRDVVLFNAYKCRQICSIEVCIADWNNHGFFRRKSYFRDLATGSMANTAKSSCLSCFWLRGPS